MLFLVMAPVKIHLLVEQLFVGQLLVYQLVAELGTVLFLAVAPVMIHLLVAQLLVAQLLVYQLVEGLGTLLFLVVAPLLLHLLVEELGPVLSLLVAMLVYSLAESLVLF